jgi:GMP synthase (glutamine-hydrolysing)
MRDSLKILVLDNNREPDYFGSHDLVEWCLKTAPVGSEIHVRRPPDQDLPRGQRFDAIVISGSITSCMEFQESWIEPYDQFVMDLIRQNTPLLGICYGHQTLARCLFAIEGQKAPLRKAQDAELGWQTIVRQGASKILDGLPEKFITFESHYEEVGEVPPYSAGVAFTDRCQVQAFEGVDRPVFAVQFHPEYSVIEGEASLAKKLKKGERRDWILNPGRGPQLYDENVGKKIFGNFFEIARNYRRKPRSEH